MMSGSTTLLQRLNRALRIAGLKNEEGDTERAQAIVRLIVPLIAAFYIITGLIFGLIAPGTARILLTYFLLFLVIATLLYLAILKQPGVNHARRMLCMFLDFGSTTFAMIIGSAFLAPLFSLLIWMTVGYGMRYGARYLGISTAVELLSFALVVIFSDYWRGQPYVVAALFVTATVVPLYAHILLKATRKAYQAASDASLAKSRFLAQASHDLRQPIHAISLFTACLRDAEIGPVEQEMVENIDRSLQSVSRLFRSLLDVATLDSGRVSPKMEVVDLGSLIKAVSEQGAEAARWANVTLKVVSTSARVRIDPNLLTIILQNLLSNAIKYAANGPVLIGCRQKGATISILVVDRGPGVPEKDRSKVFDEFFRVHVTGRDIDGVGLGLSIVRRMAALMKLSVAFDSRSGSGTSVRIDGLQVTTEATTRRTSTHSRPNALLHGMRILLIEDDPRVCLATKALLEKWGCIVTDTAEPPFEIHPYFDLVLADFDLGDGMNGADYVTGLVNEGGQPMPAIIMTGHDEGHVRQQLGERPLPVLTKPVHPAELRASLLAERLRSR